MTQLALLHGFTGAPESWHGVLAHLEADVEPFTPAMLGHRGIEAPLSAPRPDNEVTDFGQELDRIAEWLQHRGFKRGTIAGYSLGGRVTLGLLLRFPVMFRNAVVIGAHPGLVTQSARDRRRIEDEQRIEFLARKGIDAFMDNWETTALFSTQQELSKEVRRAQAAIRRNQTAAGLAQSIRVCGLSRMPNLRPRLKEIECPVELVVGQRDNKFIDLAAAMQQELPNSRLHLVEGCGHNPILERPARVASILKENCW